jgi:hypothetical protein
LSTSARCGKHVETHKHKERSHMIGPLGLAVIGILVVIFTPLDLLGWFFVALATILAVFPRLRT